MDIFAWWNLIFLLPAFAALLYLLLLATGTVDSGSDGDADVDADIDADLDADLDADVDVDGDAGLSHGVEHSVGAGEQHAEGSFARALGFLGFGRVPLSILVMTLCFLWGFAGWASNTLIGDALERPALFFPVSMVVASFAAVLGTRTLARGLARFLPATETYGSTERDLVGRLAKVRDSVTEQHGRAQLYDLHGSLQEVPVRIKPGEREIPSRTEIVLLSFDRDRGVYYALADPLGEDAPATAGEDAREMKGERDV